MQLIDSNADQVRIIATELIQRIYRKKWRQVVFYEKVEEVRGKKWGVSGVV